MTTTEPTTPSGDLVHIVVGWDHENEQAYFHEAGVGDAEHESRQFEADVPGELWRSYEALSGEWARIETELRLHAGVGDDGRLIACCEAWEGSELPPHVYWAVVLSASGDEHTWPLHDASIEHKATEAEAQAFIDSWPDEFTVHIINSHFVRVTRDRMSIKRNGWAGSVSECHRCGWDRSEHPKPAES